MSANTDPLVDDAMPMSAYEAQVWDALNKHWQRRDNRRGLPNWASTAFDRAGGVAGNAVRWVADTHRYRRHPLTRRKKRRLPPFK